MNLEQIALITNFCFLIGFAYADLRHKKEIPAYAFEPLLFSYGLFSLICFWLFPSLIFLINLLIIYLADKFKFFGNGDIFLLIFSAFIFPINFTFLFFCALIIANCLLCFDFQWYELKKQKEIEFMPIWALVNLLPLLSLLIGH